MGHVACGDRWVGKARFGSGFCNKALGRELATCFGDRKEADGWGLESGEDREGI